MRTVISVVTIHAQNDSGMAIVVQESTWEVDFGPLPFR